MAEITTSSGQKTGRRAKKLSTRVDLTPMVDLGFLLITFFVFTTSMAEPKALKLHMPADDQINPASLPSSGALTLIPLSGSRVFYYHGELTQAINGKFFGITDFSWQKGIGHIIREKQRALDAHKGLTRKDLMLIIKPTDEASYQNLVDVLDEALINLVNRYAIVDLSEEEKSELVKRGFQ